VLKRLQPSVASRLISTSGTFGAPTIRAALLLGFALIGGIWLFAGYYFTARMAELEQRSTAINSRYMRAQDLLTGTRGHVLMGSVYVRDALLDPDPKTAAAYRAQLEESYRAAEQALSQYVPVIDVPGEQERISRLRREVDEFRRTLVEVLETDSRSWPSTARDLLRGRIMPKRVGVMRISEQVQALNRSAFVQQQNEIAALYRLTQRHVWESFGLAVAASFGIAVLAMLYAGRLEDRIQRQRLKDIDTARDLQRLSSQLLTAQEEERRGIARELHDEVGQVLTAIKVELSLAQHAVEAAGAPPNLLEDARAITDGALHAVRDLSHLLHPAMLDDLGLPAVVAWYIKGFGKRHGVAAELLHERMEERLSAEVESAAYRIVQEALTNVAKHAQAKSCRVFLQRLTNTLLVTIEDDGIGFDPVTAGQLSAARGLGLVSIRERVSQLHGTLRIETGEGKGVRLTVELPARMRPAVLEDGSGRDLVAPIAAPTVREVLGG
jgi:signal transduction histidine kinase